MKHSIIIKAENKKNVLSEVKKLPCIFSLDNSLMFKNELIIDINYDYKNKAKVIAGSVQIEKNYTPVNYL